MKKKKKSAHSLHLDLDSEPITNDPNNPFPLSSTLCGFEVELFTLRTGPNLDCLDFDYSDFFKIYISGSFMILAAEQTNLFAVETIGAQTLFKIVTADDISRRSVIFADQRSSELPLAGTLRLFCFWMSDLR